MSGTVHEYLSCLRAGGMDRAGCKSDEQIHDVMRSFQAYISEQQQLSSTLCT